MSTLAGTASHIDRQSPAAFPQVSLPAFHQLLPSKMLLQKLLDELHRLAVCQRRALRLTRVSSFRNHARRLYATQGVVAPIATLMDLHERLADALVDSQAQELARYVLGNVPGLPPIVQTLHIVGISVVMASIVMIDLKFLGVAVPSQNVSEMISRLMPWTWCALPLNAVTGLLFIVARPNRYFYNPVFGIKFSLLAPAVALAFVVYRLNRKEAGYWEQTLPRRISGRVVAGCSLVLWLGVVMAGRWIAYWDYLFY